MSSKTVLETLEAARKLITPKDKWTQGADGRNSAGDKVEPHSPDAVCFCSAGAVWAVNRYGFSDAMEALRGVAKGESFTFFNDTHTHAEVLAAFDAAIAKEKEAQHVI